MEILDSLNGPQDLRRLSETELVRLAGEIRRFLITNVSKTGGHLGPNLGVVELTIALHRVFDSPADKLIFDTGHQAYVHKILTGRKDFTRLRRSGGLSGYPSRAESEHDIVENSHATTALSWADGISRGFLLSGRKDRVVAVIGDGALTGGMAWEALNNIAEDAKRPLIIVLNDNGRSYAPTVGGFIRRFDAVRKLDGLRVNRRYEDMLDWGKRALKGAGTPGQLAYETLHGLKRGMKGVFFDAGIFDSLGLKYLGPVNGHDLPQLLEALEMAKNFGAPVVVHVITEKGRGYKPAELNTDDHFHAVGAIHPETGLPLVPSRFGWTKIFADEITKIAAKNPKIIGITAAMMLPVGLGPLQKKYPQRVIDTGIAEQHALTMAAGLANSGFHPVVALYATFMNRAFDQLLMDVALHREPVTVCLDRSGITGDDGPSHNGMWDISLAAMIPGLAVGVPRDEIRMRAILNTAAEMDGPNLIRYPKGGVSGEIPAVEHRGTVDILFRRRESGENGKKPVLLVGVGVMNGILTQAAQSMDTECVVADPKWIFPISDDLVSLAKESRALVVLEDGLVNGGFGAELNLTLQQHDVQIPTKLLGIAKQFPHHDTRSHILQKMGMTAADVCAAVRALDGQSKAGEERG
ncbi:1-deoxy-D-xylulose-5-phosphate synthase [Arcanobacterium sp. S3PF19]|uniref:1-deoxy-D-xylulose-5-phosphate synthase n=1 Tax=Arcanobacterium sp. S3PF19 TaxID=1219585 RepID=UPI00050E7FF7|nr:1-deoxy-D-xylulose-5-phosphate synthase [Arcanobacterium sp. S3PF19]KGF06307.1 1-deoxy-D-xylulose-5-phosphate synthase [Arcanobacterium sp. S3PF19]